MSKAPTAEHFKFARNFWVKGSASAAGRATWPDLASAEAKGIKWAARADVKVAIEAVREMMQDQLRAEFISRGCGMDRIIELTVARLESTDTAAREFKELAMWATDLMGYSAKKGKERPPSGNRLAELVAQSAGLGAALGASLPDGRFPAVRAVFPENQGQTGCVPALPPLAAPAPDVGRPEVGDSERVP